MNQQRSGRFGTAKYAEIAEAEEERLRREFERAGKVVLPKKESEVADSNVITPGTVFMEKLALALEYYIRLRINSDPGWKSIKVILSDANVPGEGEHKIMSFIRLQRNLPGYNPNTRHCLYGLDADLIMLALATHEIHFSILREDVIKQEPHKNVMASLEASLSTKEQDMVKSRKWFRNVLAANEGSVIPKKPYLFLNIWMLREYLEIDMKILDAPFEIDFERIVDDFIFICFFTGNDFLPHLPSIEIHEAAIDLLISVYKQLFKTMGGYLVDTSRMKDKKAAYIKVKRVERFILEVGSYEDKIFEKRYKLRQKMLQRVLRERLKEDEERSGNDFDYLGDLTHGDSNDRLLLNHRDSQFVIHKESYSTCGGSDTVSESLSEKCKISSSGRSKAENTEGSDVLQNTKELKQKLKDYLRNNSDLFKNGALGNDKVKLGCTGWKGRYYREKFSAGNPTEIESTRKKIVEKYMEGLCWVLQYYFVGVRSWTWYYPFYYGPFASDLKDLSCPCTEFKIGYPFKPFDQLMAVLPPASSNALPKAYRSLMNNEDSTLINFYPHDFVVDCDGKRFTWQGVSKLPFIEEGPLLTATKMLERDLEVDEVERNSFKFDKIFVRDSHALGLKVTSIHKMSEDTTEKGGTKYPIDVASCEMNGFLSLCDSQSERCVFISPVRGMEDITDDHALSAIFKNPDSHCHIPKLLEKVTMPEKTITKADMVERKLWHEYDGFQPPQMINRQRDARKMEFLSKSTSPASASAHEIWVGAGSGSGGTGRGNLVAGRPGTGRDCGKYGESHARNLGKGRGFVEVSHCVRPIRTQVSNGGKGYRNPQTQGVGGNSNTYNSGFKIRNGGFQHSAKESVADRSENWRRSEHRYSGRGQLGSIHRWSAAGSNRFTLNGQTDEGNL